MRSFGAVRSRRPQGIIDAAAEFLAKQRGKATIQPYKFSTQLLPPESKGMHGQNGWIPTSTFKPWTLAGLDVSQSIWLEILLISS